MAGLPRLRGPRLYTETSTMYSARHAYLTKAVHRHSPHVRAVRLVDRRGDVSSAISLTIDHHYERLDKVDMPERKYSKGQFRLGKCALVLVIDSIGIFGRPYVRVKVGRYSCLSHSSYNPAPHFLLLNNTASPTHLIHIQSISPIIVTLLPSGRVLMMFPCHPFERHREHPHRRRRPLRQPRQTHPPHPKQIIQRDCREDIKEDVDPDQSKITPALAREHV